MRFVDVILPLGLPNLFTYKVPEQFENIISPGKRVIVQFGKQKIYSALVKKVHDNKPENFEPKEIISILDEDIVVNEKQFQLWDWIGNYYMAHPGDVMNAALPSMMKLESETKIYLNQEINHEEIHLNDKEYLLVTALESQKSLTLQEAAKLLRQQSAHGVVKKLMDKNLIFLDEDLKERYHPRTEKFIQLNVRMKDEKELENVFNDSGKRAAKQSEMLMVFLKLLYETDDRKFIEKKKLLSHANASPSTLQRLIEKNILDEIEMPYGQKPGAENLKPPSALSEIQLDTFEKIKNEFAEKDTVLLHGVTGSGKTEIYIHLIEENLSRGKQVLYLLPEIALTSQIINRLKKHFGEKVGVYHSRLNNRERMEVWNELKKSWQLAVGSQQSGEKRKEGLQIILGARSSIFLPFDNLGLIIVDEEHENSFKQFDPAPRYHARDTALQLARIHGAKTLLGSATPALESFYNVEKKKYGFAEILLRHGGIEMPEIFLVDVKEEERKKLMHSHFSKELINRTTVALEKKEQVIFFQNRRGFAPYLQCKSCGHTPHCIYCAVTLTYHKQADVLRCHYCGYTQKPPSSCELCGDHGLRMQGYGTEKIEEELQVFFPEAIIARLDLDSTRSKNSFRKIIGDFENRSIDILVGTQMVTKGLDFDNVSLVGIINADQMLNFPDFRAHERSYQLMAQVSGRAGRKTKRGTVIIQTQNPTHWIFSDVINNDYQSMYNHELEERKKFMFPPFYRLIEFTLKHRNADAVQDAANHLAKILRTGLGSRVLGPESPVVSKIKNLFLKTILIRIEREASVKAVKEIIRKSVNEFYADRSNLPVILQTDVDPM